MCRRTIVLLRELRVDPRGDDAHLRKGLPDRLEALGARDHVEEEDAVELDAVVDEHLDRLDGRAAGRCMSVADVPSMGSRSRTQRSPMSSGSLA